MGAWASGVWSGGRLGRCVSCHTQRWQCVVEWWAGRRIRALRSAGRRFAIHAPTHLHHTYTVLHTQVTTYPQASNTWEHSHEQTTIH